MDRKYCAFLYSNYSQASINALNYIKNLPFDFATVTGLTLVCVDNPLFKEMLLANDIEHVPVLLVEYYNGLKQKLEADYLYMWIDQVVKALRFETPQAPPVVELSEPATDRRTVLSDAPMAVQTNPSFNDDHTPSITEKRKSGKVDISALALEMQKSREIDMKNLPRPDQS